MPYVFVDDGQRAVGSEVEGIALLLNVVVVLDGRLHAEDGLHIRSDVAVVATSKHKHTCPLLDGDPSGHAPAVAGERYGGPVFWIGYCLLYLVFKAFGSHPFFFFIVGGIHFVTLASHIDDFEVFEILMRPQ